MRSNNRIVTLLCFLILTLARTALPDSWMPPAEFEAFSENRKYVAKITPATNNQYVAHTSTTRELEKPRLNVFAIDGENRTKLWSTNLSNPVSPCMAYVADDGENVVTTDNYFGVGYGEDVVAFYGKAGQIRKYSLEQIFPELNDSIDDMHKFAHSTSSRWWKKDSIAFFDPSDKDPRFCIWVDWADKWVAWNAKTGERYNPSPQEWERWNGKARDTALQRIKEGKADATEFKFLGKQRRAEDRAAIEQLLEDTRFSTSMISWEGPEGSGFTYQGYSQRRQDADQILAEWDRLAPNNEEPKADDRYYFLGVVKMIITFPQAPRRNEGRIHVYLIPDRADGAHWDASNLDQHIVVNLGDNFPSDFSGETIKDRELDKAVNFRIDGVSPGKYWIKVIWDKEAPHSNRQEVLVKPGAGDYESMDSPRITVEAGKVMDNVTLSCTELVKGMVSDSAQY